MQETDQSASENALHSTVNLPVARPARVQDLTSMLTYIAQLERLAASRKVSLSAALQKAQVSDSQLYRWRQGKGSPRLDTARRIEKAIFDLGAKREALSGAVPKRRVARIHAKPAGASKRARPQA